MNKDSVIYVAGHTGLVGSAIVRRLKKDGYEKIVEHPYRIDLRDQEGVDHLFRLHQPEYVFLVAGRVGGIKANNTRRAEFIYDNLMIQCNVMNAAHTYGTKKLLFTGSSCIYPKNPPDQPIKEEYLLASPLEKTNEPYAIAKIAGVKLCEAYRDSYGCNFISAMPCNVYGYNDTYDLNHSHVLPALLRKIITARYLNSPTIEIWGTGEAKREFIFSDDLADALLFLMDNYDSPEPINVGTSKEMSIRDLATFIQTIVGWEGEFVFNGQLDGTMRKLLDVSKIHQLGWTHSTTLQKGIFLTKEDIYKTNKYLSWVY